MRLRPRSILSKLLALFLIAAVLPLGLLGVVFYFNTMQATAEMVGNRAGRLAESVQNELELKLQFRFQDRLLAVNQPVQEYLTAVRARGDRRGLPGLPALRSYLDGVFVQSGAYYEDLVLADTRGEPLVRFGPAAPSPGAPGRPPTFPPPAIQVEPSAPGEVPAPPPAPPAPRGFSAVYSEIRERDRRALSRADTLGDSEVRLVLDAATPGQPPTAVMVMPVISNEEAGLRLGYVAARLRSSYLWPADWESRRFGERGELAVVDATTGQILYHTRQSWIGRFLGQIDPNLLGTGPPGAAPSRERPWRRVGGPDGGRVAAEQTLTRVPWVVVATAVPREFASEARRAALLNLLVGTLALLLAISLIALVGRRMSRSIQLLTARAQRVAEGDLTGPEIEAVTHDEVQTLAEAFNVMTSSLRRNIEMRERAAAELDALNRTLETRVRDRTRRLEELNAALNQANEELKELDRLKSNFLATVSHEFKTPLTSIKAFAEILHDELEAQDVPAEMRRFLRIIDSESDRLARLIKNILDLSRIESGRMVWRMTDIPAATVIDATLDGLLPAIREKEIRLERELPCLDAMLHGDPDRLQEVFTNVLDNAIKASGRGQRIVFGCRADAPSVNGAFGRLEFFVQDEGHGIPEDQLERIFDRFHQVSAEGRRRKGGTGLGLAISREIVEHHGGRIWAESRSGSGSTFHILLPRALPGAPNPTTAEPAAPPHSSSAGDPRHA